MLKQVPHYYKDFHCIASECKDNCCVGGWQINIDDETAEYYLKLKGPFGDRLRNSITKTDAYCFKLFNGKCPFLDERNLCEIYQELGEDKMGVVCTQFPRYSEYFGHIKETGIGLACEEAASIILNDSQKLSIDMLKCDEEFVDDPEYDNQLAEGLFAIRRKIFELIEDDSCTLFSKMNSILYICNEIQKCINTNDYESLDSLNIFDNHNGLKSHDTAVSDNPDNSLDKNIADSICVQRDDLKENIVKILYPYSELEVLNDDWNNEMNSIFDSVYENDSITEGKYKSLFIEFYKADKANERRYLNIIKYFIFRYFMKTTYDHDCFHKAVLAISNIIVLYNMNFVRWLSNDKHIEDKHLFDSVHIFSREVEYDEDNIEQLYEEFIFDEIFRYENISALMIILDELLS